jgi:hypothetical protein
MRFHSRSVSAIAASGVLVFVQAATKVLVERVVERGRAWIIDAGNGARHRLADNVHVIGMVGLTHQRVREVRQPKRVEISARVGRHPGVDTARSHPLKEKVARFRILGLRRDRGRKIEPQHGAADALAFNVPAGRQPILPVTTESLLPGLSRNLAKFEKAQVNAAPPLAKLPSNSFNDFIVGFIGDRRSHGHRRHAMSRTILRKSLRRWCSWRPTSRLNSFTAQGMLPTVSRRTLSCRLVDFAAPNPVQAQRAQFMASSGASI